MSGCAPAIPHFRETNRQVDSFASKGKEWPAVLDEAKKTHHRSDARGLLFRVSVLCIALHGDECLIGHGNDVEASQIVIAGNT